MPTQNPQEEEKALETLKDPTPSVAVVGYYVTQDEYNKLLEGGVKALLLETKIKELEAKLQATRTLVKQISDEHAETAKERDDLASSLAILGGKLERAEERIGQQSSIAHYLLTRTLAAKDYKTAAENYITARFLQGAHDTDLQLKQRQEKVKAAAEKLDKARAEFETAFRGT